MPTSWKQSTNLPGMMLYSNNVIMYAVISLYAIVSTAWHDPVYL